MNWFLWFLVALFAVRAIANVATVGKQPPRITPKDAVYAVIVNGLLIAGILTFGTHR